jgi:hypothetical protein
MLPGEQRRSYIHPVLLAQPRWQRNWSLIFALLTNAMLTDLRLNGDTRQAAKRGQFATIHSLLLCDDCFLLVLISGLCNLSGCQLALSSPFIQQSAM